MSKIPIFADTRVPELGIHKESGLERGVLDEELERLTINAAMHREDLLLSGLRKSRVRKALNVVAGMLALLSAGAITIVLTDLFGDQGIQILAALVAGISGSISLVIASYYDDDEIIARLNGASQYLALREATYRLAISPRLSDEERFERMAELQSEYAALDEAYSRFFSLPESGRSRAGTTGTSFQMTDSGRAYAAAEEDIQAPRNKLESQQQVPPNLQRESHRETAEQVVKLVDETKRCRHCGQTMQLGFLFCPDCGQPVELEGDQKTRSPEGSSLKACWHCDREIESNARYCPFCGKDQSHLENDTSEMSAGSDRSEDSDLDQGPTF